jgi:hypothetical protein
MIGLEASLTLARALKRGVQVPLKRLEVKNFTPLAPIKWQDFNFNKTPAPGLIIDRDEGEDSYFGYSTSNLNIVRRTQQHSVWPEVAEEEDLPILAEGDILFYTLVDNAHDNASKELKKMKPVRVKFIEGVGLTCIEGNLIDESSTLKEVCFGEFNTLDHISDDVFYNCLSLTSVSFKGLIKLNRVGANVFGNCPLLTSVSFEGLDSVENIWGDIFYNCPSLISVSFEGLNSLESIGGGVFSGCPLIAFVSFKGIELYKDIEGFMFAASDSFTLEFFEKSGLLRPHRSFSMAANRVKDGLPDFTGLNLLKYNKSEEDYECNKLTSIPSRGPNLFKADLSDVFYGSRSLVSLCFGTIDTLHDVKGSVFLVCPLLTSTRRGGKSLLEILAGDVSILSPFLTSESFKDLDPLRGR